MLLLLFLQLLILAALVAALARPALETKVVTSGSVIVMLDASASMNATDVKPSRFEEARTSVLTLINGLTSDSAMTLILAAQTPSHTASPVHEYAQKPRGFRKSLAVSGLTGTIKDKFSAQELTGRIHGKSLGTMDGALTLSGCADTDKGEVVFSFLANHVEDRKKIWKLYEEILLCLMK